MGLSTIHWEEIERVCNSSCLVLLSLESTGLSGLCQAGKAAVFAGLPGPRSFCSPEEPSYCLTRTHRLSRAGVG